MGFLKRRHLRETPSSPRFQRGSVTAATAVKLEVSRGVPSGTQDITGATALGNTVPIDGLLPGGHRPWAWKSALSAQCGPARCACGVTDAASENDLQNFPLVLWFVFRLS